MRITLEGTAAAATYLLIGENWYPDWHATVDGKAVPVHRADYTMLSVVLPAGAKEVRLWFASAAYVHGKIVTALALLITLALFLGPRWRHRRSIRHA
jgi:uncharacterized membrane protein YfhO